MDRLKNLEAKGQLELISGGYYEPILSVVSDDDKLAQLKLMNEFIGKKFKKTPQGVWVSERIWEPHLAGIINVAGLKYTFLDDTHFRYAGLAKNEFFGYYITEEALKPIFVFPISKTLRYKIPFSRVEETIGLLKSFLCHNEDILVTLFDDGEKFGLWPHTYDWVYKKGWLNNFFSLLTKNFDSIETIFAHEAITRFKPQGIVYLPCSSYEEMTEWVLEPEGFSKYELLKDYLKKNDNFGVFKDFIRGGFFRNFYRKYARLNYMHKRMLFLSRRLHNKTSPKDDKEMFKSLWRAQCNCGYWHGIFGGFYLGHIRAAIYENLIQAEKGFDKKYTKKPFIVERADIDLDGFQDTIVKNNRLICVISDRGGTILELSLKDKDFNLLNTITRQEESYHKRVKENTKKNIKDAVTIHEIIQSKEKDLDKYLIYDKYERLGLIDHVLEKNISLEKFNKQTNFWTLANEVYTVSIGKKKNGAVLSYSYQQEDLEFIKKISFTKKAKFDVEYIFNKNNLLQNYDFGVEFNLFLQSPQDIILVADGSRISGADYKTFKNISSLGIKDSYKGIDVRFSFDEADVFVMLLHSVSSSESGFEKSYQQMVILFINRINKESFNLCINLGKEV